MGCLFGARLTSHAEVALIGSWAEQIKALQRAPLRVIHPDGREELVRLRVSTDTEAAAPVDAVLIVTKTIKTRQAAQTAARLLTASGVALTLQNGLGNLEVIAQEVGPERAALGVTTLGAALDEPGVLRIGGNGVTTLASRPEIEPQVRALAALFEQAGLLVEITSDAGGVLWGKLAVNAAINPLTALLGVPNGALLESAAAREIMAQAARETAAVAAAQGIRLPFDDPAVRAEQVARQTAHNRSSMWQDLQRGVPTEVEAICGAVAQTGERLGVPAPVNRLLCRLIKAAEETRGVRRSV
jgi:2-dehydropantoate 2-reductase